MTALPLPGPVQVDMFDELWDSFDALRLPAPAVGRVFGFDEAPAALAYFQSGASVGKVVLSVEQQ